MKVYKIRNKTTGKFSSGGSDPKWTHQGKVWQRINYLQNHLYSINKIDFYNDAEIVEAEISEILSPIGSPTQYLMARIDKQIERIQERINQSPDNNYYKHILQGLRAQRALLNE